MRMYPGVVRRHGPRGDGEVPAGRDNRHAHGAPAGRGATVLVQRFGTASAQPSPLTEPIRTPAHAQALDAFGPLLVQIVAVSQRALREHGGREGSGRTSHCGLVAHLSAIAPRVDVSETRQHDRVGNALWRDWAG